MGDVFDGMNTRAGVVWLIAEIGAANWLLVEGFDFNLVNELFGAGTSAASVIFLLIGLAGLLSLAGSLGLVDVDEVLGG